MYDFNLKEIKTNSYTIIKTFKNAISIPSKKGNGVRYQSKNKAKSEYESLHRTRQKIFDYALANEFEYFTTFTFDKEKVEDRFNLDLLSKKLTIFLNNCRKLISKDIKYIIIPEQHKNGAWHLHALIKGLPIDELTFYKTDNYGNDLYNWDRFTKKFGFNSILSLSKIPFKDLLKVYGYIVKYITKDLCQSRINKKRYWSSKGLVTPVKTQYLLDNESLIKYQSILTHDNNIIHHNSYDIKHKETKEIVNTVNEFVLLDLPF